MAFIDSNFIFPISTSQSDILMGAPVPETEELTGTGPHSVEEHSLGYWLVL